ncbi:MAG: bifunctional isocitrate dehydrogenase kinase/phosphatase [Legionellaceae bacterium]|nr:bifunctional isocitrate dehydrogenase kinase/phosphatase [Legionellaceae bacterium]
MGHTDARIAEIIIKGFRRHYRLFMAATAQAKGQFETANWKMAKHIRTARIAFYDDRVSETVALLKKKYPSSKPDTQLWIRIKRCFQEYLTFHPQAELAETFYNSVFCNLFSWPYFNNNFIFVESTLQRSQLPAPVSSVYSRYFPAQTGLKQTIIKIFQSFHLRLPFIDLDRDIGLLVQHFITHSRHGRHPLHKIRLDIIQSLFFRNKAAYIVGRVVTPSGQQSFVIPLLQENHHLYVDALIMDSKMLSIIFGFYRAYFMVETETPSALVYFLQELMPDKTRADLYAIIGLHKQGKAEFYRELLHTLNTTESAFHEAPGIAGMVMFVFTLPDFPYVFKVIRDKFGINKDMGPDTVKSRYYLVKNHDRAGRMADTLEYSNVALPVKRFDPALLQLMLKELNHTIRIEGDYLIIKHLYIERRMTPLNVYLDRVSKSEQSLMIRDYGQALKDMIAVNIFPGDMLLKNFGVTPFGRIVFYDYDEVQYLLDINFRHLPEPKNLEQEMAREPWYSVMPNDFFPEEIITFVVTDPWFRECLRKHHPELLDPVFWQNQQERIRQGIIEDIFPYPEKIRFKNQYPAKFSR